MSDADIAGLGLARTAEAIVARRLSSVEATRAALARLARIGEPLLCAAELDEEGALAAAARADEELAAGSVRGPLHGVPLAHKDMFYRAGRTAACGSRIRADFVPDHTATVLERLDAAGALDVGRLNMVEFAMGPTGHNEITGTPRNPWDPERIPGGSSSGPAIAVAARLVSASLGSDTGGSVRVPAACCGLVGMKPTYGRISRYGVMPLSYSLDTVGPLTRTVGDCALMLNVLAGHDPRDATSSRRQVPDYRDGLDDGVRGMRIAVAQNYFPDPVTPEVEHALDAALNVYRALGARLVPLRVPTSLAQANALTVTIILAEAAACHMRWIRERAGDYGSQTLMRLQLGRSIPATQYIDSLRLRERLLGELAHAVFEKADVLFVPVVPMAVPTIAESDLRANPGAMDYVVAFGHCTRPFNYLALPAMSVPAGFTPDGLPVGLQLVGRPFDEALLLRAARAYERETGWTEPVPPVV